MGRGNPVPWADRAGDTDQPLARLGATALLSGGARTAGGRLRRGVAYVGLGVALAALLATSVHAAGTPTSLSQPPPTTCNGVPKGGGDGPLLKTVVTLVGKAGGTPTYPYPVRAA